MGGMETVNQPQACCGCSYFIFRVFSPEIACQAPKALNPLLNNNIRVAFKLCSTRYNGYIDQKQASPGTLRG
jgi:hypothetical protein